MRDDDTQEQLTEIRIVLKEPRVTLVRLEIPYEVGKMSNRFSALAFTAVVASVALAPRAQAQDQQPEGQPAGERLDPRQVIDMRMAKLTETLKLDSTQQDKVRWIVAAETMQMEALRKNGGRQRAGGEGQGGGRGGGGRRGGRRGGATPDSTGGGGSSAGPPKEVLAIRDSTNKQIEGLLNAEQLTTFRQLFEHKQ